MELGWLGWTGLLEVACRTVGLVVKILTEEVNMIQCFEMLGLEVEWLVVVQMLVVVEMLVGVKTVVGGQMVVVVKMVVAVAV